MIFEFEEILPDPLESIANPESDLWKTRYTISSEEHILMQGGSGKGKSTFAHILFGLRHDYKGKVCLDSTDIRSIPLLEWARLRRESLSLIFQDLRLFPTLSALENVQVKNRLTNYKAEEEIKFMFERLGIADQLDQSADTLSYGQRQRVAIIRSLCQPFKLLIMDEPFSHLDRENVEIASALISEEIEKQGAGFILTTLDAGDLLKTQRTLIV